MRLGALIRHGFFPPTGLTPGCLSSHRSSTTFKPTWNLVIVHDAVYVNKKCSPEVNIVLLLCQYWLVSAGQALCCWLGCVTRSGVLAILQYVFRSACKCKASHAWELDCWLVSEQLQ